MQHDAASTKRGSIVIARHGRPALDRTLGPRLSWREYIDWWARYEAGGLAEDQKVPQKLIDTVSDAAVLLTSERQRAQETMARATGARPAEAHALFNEAPLPPPTVPGLKFLPKTWNVLSRSAWYWGHSLGQETHHQARLRARKAAEELDRRSLEGMVFLAAHGWFNRMIRPELKSLGWRCAEDGGDLYWGYRRYEFRGTGH